MSHEKEAERALTRLVDEARRETPPDVNWDTLEASLMAQVARERRAPSSARRTQGARKPWLAWSALGLAAAAAVAVFAAGGVRPAPSLVETKEPVAATEAHQEPAPPANLDGNALGSGAVVTTTRLPVVVEHRGHAEWTLEPDGVARVQGIGPVVTIALDRGALSAHVTKSPRPESFVVLVERARIAVHGTAFRVERLDDRVRVDVTEGVVSVGPATGGKAFEVTAGGTATVNFEGLSIGRSAAAPVAASRGAQAAPRGTAAPASEPPASTPAAQTPLSPAPQGEAGVDRVVQAIQRCFAEDTVAGGDLRVSVMTRMSLHVETDGRIVEAVFSPPLAPAVRACVDAAAAKLTLPRSEEGMSVERTLELER